ncbi:AAA family ATPase [Chloroflexi bacterium TSY]|nr:AAA family ATPase [Chloroflexi bacterium TSY]
MIQILFLAANPSDTPPLKLDEESRTIDEALRQSEYRENFDFQQHWALRIHDVQELLMRYKPHLVHFSGHGTDTNELVLIDDSGNAAPLTLDVLEGIFAVLQDNIRCVVLNACFSETQAEVIAQHIDCVVGMSNAISDTASITFAKSFYQAIGYGRDIQSSFELACLQISSWNLDEQYIPQLVALHINPTQISFIEGVPEPSTKRRERHDAKNKYRRLEENKDKDFSTVIRAQLSDAKKVVETLTTEQFRIIQWLRGHRRAAITGCAGSGKTLVAAEKAVRLDKAGLQTLILCHNPTLAAYFSSILTGTGVTVNDFTSWVDVLLGRKVESFRTWTNYYEPTQKDIDSAFDVLTNTRTAYDAIIVDEAQDFRDTWWILIEAALTDSQGILYIFFDDNQSLLPQRSKYPIEEAPYTLSKNCRNAGRVFNLVRCLHPQAPEPSFFLADSGIAKLTTCDLGQEKQAIASAIQAALRLFLPEQLTVLTTESGNFENSILNGLTVQNPPKWKWQSAVTKYLKQMSRTGAVRKPLTHEIRDTSKLVLSDEPYPTEQDIETVSRFAQRLINAAGSLKSTQSTFTFW